MYLKQAGCEAGPARIGDRMAEHAAEAAWRNSESTRRYKSNIQRTFDRWPVVVSCRDCRHRDPSRLRMPAPAPRGPPAGGR